MGEMALTKGIWVLYTNLIVFQFNWTEKQATSYELFMDYF